MLEDFELDPGPSISIWRKENEYSMTIILESWKVCGIIVYPEQIPKKIVSHRPLRTLISAEDEAEKQSRKGN